MLGTPRLDSTVVRSPRVGHGEWTGHPAQVHQRRNSFDQPFSPLIAAPSSPPDSPKQHFDRRPTFARQTSSLRRRLPSFWQAVAVLAAVMALWRSYRLEGRLGPLFSWSQAFSPSSSSPSSPSSKSTTPPLSPLDNPSHIPALSAVIVGPRTLPPQYHAHPSACNSSQLLAALSRARIRADGASRLVDYSVPPEHHSLRGSGFRFSYDLEAEGCRAPHLYEKDEACDLLRAFGGVMLRGDSFVRHVVNALFILVSGSNGGAVVEQGERCRGNAMFDDRKAHCREKSVTNSQAMPQPVCGGDAHIFFDYAAWGAQPPHLLLNAYDQWRWSLPAHKQILSHLYIAGVGLHHHLNTRTGILGFVRPFLTRSKTLFPRPVGLWTGIHAPAPGKPERWAEEQGEKNVKRYNGEVQQFLEAVAPGEFVEESAAMKVVDWYNVTDGAESYDGSHYSYQVNMEKAVILLNLLDTIWGEAVDAGGLLETF
ncbi:hypothetical protein JCM6882_000865 [Rhodosporidiobolus microsporus]